MSRRLQPTMLDYMVVAINPALIMLLIGSLVYFLLEMFYQGQYPERLHWCLTMFVFGSVLIARISMEDGLERAAPFGIALALVMCMAMWRFVDYKGSSYEQLAWLINYALIGLILWCAYKLTWDCTLMDETQDASGEGLLQTAGLDTKKDQSRIAPVADEKDTKNEANAKRNRKKKNAEIPTDAIAPPDKNATKTLSWWQRFLERRRRPHAPGLWVVYFSLAALPIFGIGQVLIPVENTGSRRYTFALLCVYVACGLGLLASTSLLGLRRYLRQRRLEMPVAMAGTWLTIGALLIVSILIFTALLPRPNAEYEISQLPWEAKSVEHDSSKFAIGHEGTKDDQAAGGSGTRKSLEGNDQDLKSGGVQHVEHPETGGSQKSDQQSSNQPSSEPTEHPSDGQSGKSQTSSSSGGKSSDQPSNEASGYHQPGKSNDKEATQSQAAQKSVAQSQKDSRSAATQEGKDSQPNQDRSAPSKPSTEEQNSQTAPRASEAQTAESPAAEKPLDFFKSADWLFTVFKWIFYGAVVLFGMWWLWRHPGAISAWIQSLLSGWRSFWQRLFGRSRQAAELASRAVVRKSFLDFSNPFSSGMAARANARELVRYSFDALEAWARDNNCPRDSDQTPLEFARQLGGHAKHLSKPAYVLAELYSISAYSAASLPASSAQHLQKLWQLLEQEWAVT